MNINNVRLPSFLVDDGGDVRPGSGRAQVLGVVGVLVGGSCGAALGGRHVPVPGVPCTTIRPLTTNRATKTH